MTAIPPAKTVANSFVGIESISESMVEIKKDDAADAETDDIESIIGAGSKLPPNTPNDVDDDDCDDTDVVRGVVVTTVNADTSSAKATNAKTKATTETEIMLLCLVVVVIFFLGIIISYSTGYLESLSVAAVAVVVT
mmetsp:Transcript_22738/g.53881  ORF Transcript_22738/g.53881 Transcript_22738/m.53881 type:complete len:137 (-) Transcript_22738:48-458(-)